MLFQKFMKMFVVMFALAILAGCTITGEPRSENVAFDNDGYMVSNEEFKDSIAVNKISNFPGTSKFTYGGRLAPNFSDESFKNVLESSLKNADLSGTGYTLDAELVDSGDWSDWSFSLGDLSRDIIIKYTLKENDSIIFSKNIESGVTINNKNILTPFYSTQKDAAEKSYAQNIEKLIKEINNL